MAMNKTNMALAAAFVGAQLSGVQAQTGSSVTIDQNGIAQCGNMGNNAASAGKKPTDFANQFWSHMGCGLWDQAQKILDVMPKADPQEPLPKASDMHRDDVADCYYKSFAYDFTYHTRRLSNPEAGDGKMEVKHGWYVMTDEKFSALERATLEACRPKIS